MLAIRKAEAFVRDIELQFQWYETHATGIVALRYLLAIDVTLQKLASQPDLGRIRHFQHAELRGIRSFPAQRPYEKHLLFYRYDETTIDAVRVIHGARDLSKRLLEQPGRADN